MDDVGINRSIGSDDDIALLSPMPRQIDASYLENVDFEGAPRIYNQEKTLIDRGMAAGPPALLDAFFARERERG